MLKYHLSRKAFMTFHQIICKLKGFSTSLMLETMKYDIKSSFEVGMSIGHFSTGIVLFSIPFMIETMSVSVYTTLQLLSLAINIYLVFNILELENPKKSLEKTLYYHTKVYGILYFILSFWVLIPLTPIAGIVSICLMNINNVKKWEILLPVAILIYLISHLRENILFKILHICIPGFWLLVIFILFEIGSTNNKVSINWVPENSLDAYQYSFIFFSTLAQTYAHDYLILNREKEKEINLRLSFAIALVYNAVLTFIFGIVGAIYGAETGNVLESIKYSPFYAFLQFIYAAQLAVISAILIEKYQPYPGSAKVGRLRLQYQRHSDNAALLEPAIIESNSNDKMLNQPDEPREEENIIEEEKPRLKELTGKEIALNEICPILALLVVFLLSIFTHVNISVTINFCSNFGGLFVSTVPGIVLSPREYRGNNSFRLFVIILLTVWSTSCSIVQLIESIKAM